MDLIYNIDFEIAGLIYVLIIYAASSIFYSNQSEVNKKFKSAVKCVLATEFMDIATAITISYGSMIPPALNTLANTVYFVLTFSVGYFFLRYVESYVDQGAAMKKTIRVNRIFYLLQLALLIVNIFTGFVFRFTENGKYLHGDQYLIVYIIPLYYIISSTIVLIRNQRFFKTKQKVSIGVYIFMCVLGPLLQMTLFPHILLSVFTPSIAILVILFSMETPDYQLLMKTLAELENLRKNLQIEVKKQTKAAEEILTTISELPGISIGAKYHHEKYDGTGYPSKITGEEIPFAARIIGIADAYDAMSSKRSYRDILPQQEIRKEVEKGKGTQFDPTCADIMLQMMDEDKSYQMREH